MNPSANGWIKKLISVLDQYNDLTDLESLYPKLRSCGFIYGNNVFIVDKIIEKKDFSSEEICKINFAIAFFTCHKKSNSKQQFTESIIAPTCRDSTHDITIQSQGLKHRSLRAESVDTFPPILRALDGLLLCF